MINTALQVLTVLMTSSKPDNHFSELLSELWQSFLLLTCRMLVLNSEVASKYRTTRSVTTTHVRY